MTTNQQTTIGAFVLGGLILVFGIIFFFGNFNLFARKQEAIIIFQGPISGLSIGAPVTFRGVQVGTVTSINIQFDSKARKAYIPVVINVDPTKIKIGYEYKDFKDFMEQMIQNGLCAELSTESFVTGSSNIFLDFDNKNIAIFHPKFSKRLIEIPTHPSAIQKIKSELVNLQLTKLSTDLDTTVQELGQLTETLNTQIPPLIMSVKNTSDTTDQLLENLRQPVYTLIANLNTLLVNGNKQIEGRGKELHTVLVSTNKTLTQTSEALENIKSMTSPRSPSRTNLEIILRNLADAATSFRGFATEIERNPKLLLIGRQQ